MKTIEDLKKDHPDFVEELKADPIHDLFEGIDPRDLEVLPEEFKVYPGSVKGSSPQDDPEHYSEWMYQNLPKAYDLLLKRSQSMVDSMVHEIQEKSFFDKKNDETNNKYDNTEKNQTYNMVSIAESPIYHWQHTTLNSFEENVDNGISTKYTIPAYQNGSYTDIPLIPNNLPSNWDQQAWFQQNWSGMRYVIK